MSTCQPWTTLTMYLGHKQGSIKEQGKILRQGDLTVVQTTKHRKRVFLFEQTIILAKKKKPKSQAHDIAGSEVFDFKASFKVQTLFAFSLLF